MIEKEITIQQVYDFTCVLLHNKIKEVQMSTSVMDRLQGSIDDAMEQGAKICFANHEPATTKRHIQVSGFVFIENPNIDGVMCFVNHLFNLSGKDVSFEEVLGLLNNVPGYKA